MIRSVLAFSLFGAATLLSGCDMPAGTQEADLTQADASTGEVDGFNSTQGPDSVDMPRR